MSKYFNIKAFVVPDGLSSFRQDTIDRLAYLYPDVEFSTCKIGIECRSTAELDLKKLNEEIRYGLFRTKIRAEGQVNRLALFDAVFLVK